MNGMIVAFGLTLFMVVMIRLTNRGIRCMVIHFIASIVSNIIAMINIDNGFVDIGFEVLFIIVYFVLFALIYYIIEWWNNR